ncbi:hypothetical protein YC2023_032760 [Brassica napus]
MGKKKLGGNNVWSANRVDFMYREKWNSCVESGDFSSQPHMSISPFLFFCCLLTHILLYQPLVKE